MFGPCIAGELLKWKVIVVFPFINTNELAGVPFEEIGATLGITTKAARRRVERAVNRLRPIVQIQRAVV